jgi:DNA polymerase-3 subunit epsilon
VTSIRDLVEPEPQPFTGTPWFDCRFVSLDLETTDPEPTRARIVTASVLEIGGRRPTVSRSWIVDPDVEIPAGATAVHGITTEQAREVGELAGDAVPAIIDTLAARPDGCPIVVFNAPYDLTVLDREARRCGVTPLQDRGPLLAIDPLTIDKHIHRYRPGSRKLGPMAEWYRVTTGADGHDADYDARLAAFLARRICRDALVIRRDDYERNPLQAEWDRIRCDPAALHAAQVRWYGFQARGLAVHFRQQGKHADADRVREDWPLVPVAA